MKMTKKILMGAVAFAAVMFMGCKEIGSIDWKTGTSGDGTKTFKVKQTNETEGIIRGMKQVDAASRAGGAAVVQINDQTATSHDGVAGFIAGYEEDKTTGKFSFLVVGVQNCGDSKATVKGPRFYASIYYNITEDILNDDNFGVTKSANIVSAKKADDFEEPYEVVLQSWKAIPAALVDDVLEVGIDIGTTRDGEYTINLYKQGDYKAVTQSAQFIPNTDAAPIATVKASTAQTGRTEADLKGKIFTYANIQPGKTLNARWDIYNLTFKTDAAALEDLPTYGDIDWE